MSEVLIVAEHINSHVSKPALELLTLARRLGQPVAVIFGDIEDTIIKALGEYGATRVLSVNDPAIEDYLVAPKAEALAEIAETVQPAAILITSTPEGKEIAGRLAVKLDSGLITDASDVAADGTTMQSVFAGNWTVTASVTRGAPVITVKPNAVAIEAAPTEPVTEQIEVTISDAAKTARILSKEPKRSSGRPDLTEAAVVVSGGRAPAATSPPSRNWPTYWAVQSVPHGQPSMLAGTRMRTRSARLARPSHLSSTSPSEFLGRSSTAPECKPRKRSWQSTRIPRLRSSRLLILASSATCTRCFPT